MAQQHEIGKTGEELARRFLEGEGYRILETNWRYSRAEVDLIAMDGQALVFVEVKTRSTDAFGRPEEFVSLKKQRLMAMAAGAYMEAIGHYWEVRFDVVSILYRSEADYELRHLKDAFFPGLA
ncbi:MAG: YraN family protein [Phaeodactylibacter sp.]|nr:YraN family protein [Phaeodactylibacter sp.]MCB9276645.1 YraN family protein [Lewinellaceae bacterium]